MQKRPATGQLLFNHELHWSRWSTPRLHLFMNRRLVLTNESARHPFRQIMPPPVLGISPYREPLSGRALFLLTFVSAFLAFSTFLA